MPAPRGAVASALVPVGMASFGDATVHEVAAEPEPAAGGALPTVTSAAGSDYVPASALEARIAEVIKGITEKREQKPKFVKIQLRFPKVAAVFEKVKETFSEIDEDKSGTIELGEIKTAIGKVRQPLSPKRAHRSLFSGHISVGVCCGPCRRWGGK